MKKIFILSFLLVFSEVSFAKDSLSYQEAIKYFQDRDNLASTPAFKKEQKAPALSTRPQVQPHRSSGSSQELRYSLPAQDTKRFFETSMSLGGFLQSETVIPQDLNLELRLRLSRHGNWSTWLELRTLVNSVQGEARLAVLQKLRYTIDVSQRISALIEGGLGISYTDDTASLKSWQRPWDKSLGAAYRFGGSHGLQVALMFGRRGAFAWSSQRNPGDLYLRWTLGFQF